MGVKALRNAIVHGGKRSFSATERKELAKLDLPMAPHELSLAHAEIVLKLFDDAMNRNGMGFVFPHGTFSGPGAAGNPED